MTDKPTIPPDFEAATQYRIRLEAVTAERAALRAQVERLRDTCASVHGVLQSDIIEYDDVRNVLDMLNAALAAPAPKVPPESVLPPLRDCCGTFAGSEHRITCRARFT